MAQLAQPSFASPFNRTIVELKYAEPFQHVSALQSFNRTIVELKFTKQTTLI